MKIKVTMKDPDGFHESVNEAVRDELKLNFASLDEDEFEALVEYRMEKAWKALKPWVEYNEYLTVEFDTGAGTATVVKKG